MSPVHDPAACYAADCHHHTGPLEPRDAPPPANPENTPQMHHGGHVTGPGGPVLMRLDPDEHIENHPNVQEFAALCHRPVTLYRYPDAEPPCEHGATLTFRTGVMGGHHLTFATPLTYCFDCHALAPTPQEDPQP